jgi:hypothetical protein
MGETLDRPLVVLLEQNGADEPHDRGLIGDPRGLGLRVYSRELSEDVDLNHFVAMICVFSNTC